MNLKFDGFGINGRDGRRLASFTFEGLPDGRAGLGKLFAYAPDLLAALEAALVAVEYYHDREGAEELLYRVRDAIAGAKGER